MQRRYQSARFRDLVRVEPPPSTLVHVKLIRNMVGTRHQTIDTLSLANLKNVRYHTICRSLDGREPLPCRFFPTISRPSMAVSGCFAGGVGCSVYSTPPASFSLGVPLALCTSSTLKTSKHWSETCRRSSHWI